MTTTLPAPDPDIHDDYSDRDEPPTGSPSNVRTYYADIFRVIHHFTTRIDSYTEAERYYKGNIGEIYANEFIASVLEETGDAYLCNFSGRVVEEAYNRINIQSVLVRTFSADAQSQYINDSLDTTIDGETGASTPTIASGPDPTAPSVFPADTEPGTDVTSPEQHTARTEILGHPTQDDPRFQSAANQNPITPGSSTPGAVTGDLPRDTDEADKALQLMWRNIWRRNKLENFFPRWIKKTLICGDGYAMAWDDGGNGIQCEVLDPLTTCVIYDEENEDRELFGARWFATTDRRKRMTLYYNDRIVKLVSKANSPGTAPADYIPYADPADQPYPDEHTAELPAVATVADTYPFINQLTANTQGPSSLYAALAATVATSHAPLGQPQGTASAQRLIDAAHTPAAGQWPLPNPHRRNPIFHLRTTDDDCYGTPAHKPSYGPQNSINKLIAVQMETTDAQGWPTRYGLQKSGTIDDLAFDEDTDDELPPDRHTSTIEDRPGTVNLLKDVDSLVQMAAADPDGFLKPMLTYIKFMSFVCATPMSFYDTLGQMPSDDTQRENNGPLIMKCGAYKRVMNPTIESFTEFLFSLLKQSNVVVHVQWAQSQMVNDLAGWQVLAGKLASGVPFDVVMQEAGYTESQIASWPTPSTGFTARINMVLQLAQAAQALAPAIEGNVISQNDANALMQQMLNDIRNAPTDASSRTNVSFRA
jgi:hypothetical protein